jgi:hypothetical protein
MIPEDKTFKVEFPKDSLVTEHFVLHGRVPCSLCNKNILEEDMCYSITRSMVYTTSRKIEMHSINFHYMCFNLIAGETYMIGNTG